MIDIIKIEWLSREAKEAVIYLSDSIYNIDVFVQPFEECEKIIQPLYAINTENINLSLDNTVYVKRKGDSLAYDVSGYIINKQENTIKVGEFLIQTDIILPQDLNEGDCISFQCDRIDMW